MLDVEVLKQSATLSTVIEQHSGAILSTAHAASKKTLCLFHAEKTPSMYVNDDSGYYHCFGCGVGGDVINFLVEYEQMTFVEAVQTLSREIGVDVGTPGRGQRNEPDTANRAVFHALNSRAAQLYHDALTRHPNATAAHDYMRSKRLTYAVTSPWSPGFAPGRRWLTDQLVAEGFAAEQIVAAGLATDRNGAVRDYFYGRIVFPIRDYTGQTLGFTARRLGDEPTSQNPPPKYLNTRATLVYDKSRSLYGIDQARTTARKLGWVVICEGATDVLALAMAGISNAVALCGTTFGTRHLALIRRLFGPEVRIVVLLDGDSAGKVASRQLWDRLKRTRATVECVALPDGSDPGDLVSSGRQGVLSDLVKSPKPMAGFFVQQHLEQAKNSSPETISDLTKAALGIIDGWSDVVAAAQYRRQIAAAAGVEEGALAAMETPQPVEREPFPDTTTFEIEREALRLLAQYQCAVTHLDGLPAHVWSRNEYRNTYHHLLLLRRTEADEAFHKKIDAAQSFPHRSLCFQVLVEKTLAPSSGVDNYIAEVASMLRIQATRVTTARVAAATRTGTVSQRRAALSALITEHRTHLEETTL